MKNEIHQAAGAERMQALLGTLYALLLIGFFTYPAGAHPREALMLSGVLAATAAGCAAGCLARAGAIRTVWLGASARGPVIFGMLLTGWIAARWGLSEVPSAGREALVNALTFAMALGAGVGIGTLAASGGEGSVEGFERTLPRIMIVAAGACALHAIYQYAWGFEAALEAFTAGGGPAPEDVQASGILDALERRRVHGRLGNPNLFAAQAALLAIFCGAGMMRRTEPKSWRVAGGGALAGLTIVLWMTDSRGGMLTFVFALALLGMAWARMRGEDGDRGNANPKEMALWIAGVFLATMAAGARAGWLESLQRIDTIRERFFYWEIALKLWARHPLAGAGPGGFELHYMALKDPLARESQYAHSWIFQSLADLGLIGLVLTAGFWATGGWLAWKAWRRLGAEANSHAQARWRLWPLLALLVLAFNGLFEFSLQWLPFGVAAGLFAGLGSVGEVEEHVSIGRRRWGWTTAAVMGAAMVIWVTIAPRHYRVTQLEWEGRVLLREGAAGAAAEAYADARSLLPEDPTLLFGAAMVERARGQSDKALALLRQAAAENPYSAAAHAGIAQLYEERGESEAALTAWDEAIERTPSNVDYRTGRARALIESGLVEAAREELATIENEGLHLWPFQREGVNRLREAVGMEKIDQADEGE